jgi:hypothetical protein
MVFLPADAAKREQAKLFCEDEAAKLGLGSLGWRAVPLDASVLGSLARQSSRRWNFAVFSLYRTDLGGPTGLPGLVLPRYRALTLAGAGQFLVLHTDTDPGSSR